MILIANVFLNLGTPEKVVRQMSKRSCFRGPFDNEHGRQAETLLKSEQQRLHQIY